MQQEHRRVLADTGEVSSVKIANGKLRSQMASKIINFNSDSQVEIVLLKLDQEAYRGQESKEDEKRLLYKSWSGNIKIVSGNMKICTFYSLLTLITCELLNQLSWFWLG